MHCLQKPLTQKRNGRKVAPWWRKSPLLESAENSKITSIEAVKGVWIDSATGKQAGCTIGFRYYISNGDTMFFTIRSGSWTHRTADGATFTYSSSTELKNRLGHWHIVRCLLADRAVREEKKAKNQKRRQVVIDAK